VDARAETKTMTVKPDRVRVQIHLPSALSPLCEIPQWLIWRWEQRKGKWTKPPYMAAKPERAAKNNDPGTWCSYERAVKSMQHGDGIGFALLDTKFDVVDLDHCRNPDTGEIDTWAQEWLDAANGAYVEITPSGEGLRIIGLGEGEKLHRKFKIPTPQYVDDDGNKIVPAIEIYRGCERYITVTGAQIGECETLAQTNGLLEKIQATYGNSARDFNKAGKQGGIDYDDVIRNGAPAGSDVSAVFHSVVGHHTRKACRSTRSSTSCRDTSTESDSATRAGCGRRSNGRLGSGTRKSGSKRR
jgi:hypothetical protein